MATGSNVASGILVGGELNAAMTDTALSMELKSGQIAGRFPSIPTNGYYYLLVIDTNVVSPTDPLDRVEVIRVESISSDTFSWSSVADRGLEGTVAKAFPITSSDPVNNVWVRIAHTVEQIKELVHDYLEMDEQAAVPDTPLATQVKTFPMAAGTGSAIFAIDDAAMIAPLLGGAEALADTDHTLTNVSPRYNVINPNALRTLTLDGTLMKMPAAFFIYNAASVQRIFIKAGTDYYTLGGHEWVMFMALQDVPTTGAHWAKMGGSSKIRVFTETTQTFTADAGADTISLGTDDGLANASVSEYDKAFYASTDDTLPAGLAASTAYYIKSAAAGTCQLSLTPGGATINITDTGAGTHTLTPQWIPPLGVQRIWAKLSGGCAGGGGAAYDATPTPESNGGGGSGGSGAVVKKMIPVVPATAYAISIGLAGTGGSAGGDASSGSDGVDGAGTTAFSLTADGGDKGKGANSHTGDSISSGSGGVGGTATGGDVNEDGANGMAGAYSEHDTGTSTILPVTYGIPNSLGKKGGQGGGRALSIIGPGLAGDDGLAVIAY